MYKDLIKEYKILVEQVKNCHQCVQQFSMERKNKFYSPENIYYFKETHGISPKVFMLINQGFYKDFHKNDHSYKKEVGQNH